MRQDCPEASRDSSQFLGQDARPPRQTGSLSCSTSVTTTSNRRAAESRSVRLSANSPRPERRSDDGQRILKPRWPHLEQPSDLLLCGAPLRNRTVDLLLTMLPSASSRISSVHFACIRPALPMRISRSRGVLPYIALAG